MRHRFVLESESGTTSNQPRRIRRIRRTRPRRTCRSTDRRSDGADPHHGRGPRRSRRHLEDAKRSRPASADRRSERPKSSSPDLGPDAPVVVTVSINQIRPAESDHPSHRTGLHRPSYPVVRPVERIDPGPRRSDWRPTSSASNIVEHEPSSILIRVRSCSTNQSASAQHRGTRTTLRCFVCVAVSSNRRRHKFGRSHVAATAR